MIKPKYILTFALMAASSAVIAQGGPGAERGTGKGPMAGWSAASGNTPGWSLMTPEERTTHQKKIRSLQTRSECQAYMDEHLQMMQTRSKEKGKEFKPGPRHANLCARFKS